MSCVKPLKCGLALAALLAGVMAGCWLAALAPASAQTFVGATYFDGPLEPHGYWVEHPDYGRAWRPRAVGPDWRPYTYGRWVYTNDYGWLWVSEEPWGWAVYHYGRWVWSSRYGWVWVPGEQWRPAWVEWCSGGGYISWSPMPPEPYWQSGYYYGTYDCRSPSYYSRAVFISESNFAGPSVSAHVVAKADTARIASAMANTTRYGLGAGGIINHSVDVTRLQAAIGRTIKPLRVLESKTAVLPTKGAATLTEIKIYRPVRVPRLQTEQPLKLDPPAVSAERPLGGRSIDGATLPPLGGGEVFPGGGGLGPQPGGLPPVGGAIGAPPLGGALGGRGRR